MKRTTIAVLVFLALILLILLIRFFYYQLQGTRQGPEPKPNQTITLLITGGN